MVGQEVVNMPINGSYNMITLEKSGNYIVKVVSNGNVTTKKLFIH